jgi:multidrug efflux pump subunit AcrB
MHKIKMILITLAIVVLSATSFKCIAQAAQVPSFDNHKGYVGTVLEISASEATVEVNRKLAKRPGGRRRPGARRSVGVVVVDENAGNNQEQDIIQEQERKQDQERKEEEERRKEQERKKYEEKINKEDWFR